MQNIKSELLDIEEFLKFIIQSNPLPDSILRALIKESLIKVHNLLEITE